jgi:16S rRNA (cytidine1402-2'-O)-methyltransferase
MVQEKKGMLSIVTTPIGNLGDLSPRATEYLTSADIIACEDTRHTGLLLSRLGIKKKLLSYNDFNEKTRTHLLMDFLSRGNHVALVSDAGTPGISDPAYTLIRSAIDEGYPVFAIPGPSAVLSALVVSGLPLDRFVFEGFLPRKGAKREKHIESLINESRTIVLFESPFRIKRLLQSILEMMGDREISVSREMTKLHEETIRGRVSVVISYFETVNPRGEYTVVIRGKGKEGIP